MRSNACPPPGRESVSRRSSRCLLFTLQFIDAFFPPLASKQSTNSRTVSVPAEPQYPFPSAARRLSLPSLSLSLSLSAPSFHQRFPRGFLFCLGPEQPAALLSAAQTRYSVEKKQSTDGGVGVAAEEEGWGRGKLRSVSFSHVARPLFEGSPRRLYLNRPRPWNRVRGHTLSCLVCRALYLDDGGDVRSQSRCYPRTKQPTRLNYFWRHFCPPPLPQQGGFIYAVQRSVTAYRSGPPSSLRHSTRKNFAHARASGELGYVRPAAFPLPRWTH